MAMLKRLDYARVSFSTFSFATDEDWKKLKDLVKAASKSARDLAEDLKLIRKSKFANHIPTEAGFRLASDLDHLNNVLLEWDNETDHESIAELSERFARGWLFKQELPSIYRDFFKRKPGFSYSKDSGDHDGPFVRFVRAVCREMQLPPPQSGTALKQSLSRTAKRQKQRAGYTTR